MGGKLAELGEMWSRVRRLRLQGFQGALLRAVSLSERMMAPLSGLQMRGYELKSDEHNVNSDAISIVDELSNLSRL
ncbi:hypothetical protein SERLA73DRAFT_190650, partial [Serpula lacrymans var. lacrymans S7.3]